MSQTTTQADKVAAFRKLHESGCFLLPNPWDGGSARYLEALGFKALASTSAGFAWSMGRMDYGLKVDEVVDHLAVLCRASALPVNADFEGGFAVEPEGVASNVKKAVAAGIAGLSIEDRSEAGASDPLLAFDLSVERIRAARAAIDETGTGVVLTARCEAYLVGQTDIDLTVERLTAYAEAGADCLYAPGLRTDADITAMVKAAGKLPVNVIALEPSWTPTHLEALGVRRISVGARFAQAAYGASMQIAKAWLEGRDLSAITAAAPPIPFGKAFA